MVEKTFHDFVKSLCLYYERREPREQTLDLWFREVMQIPDEPLEGIRQQICRQQEAFPRNLPVLVRELWQKWREDNPRKQAHPHTDLNCRECDGTGLITGYREGRAYAFRCGRCRQSTLHGIPFATAPDLTALGYARTETRKGRQRVYG